MSFEHFVAAADFHTWLMQQQISRKITRIQHHHTFMPDYKCWERRPNPLYWQSAMRDFHINERGWSDIGQHLTIFPDGSVVTGRGFEKDPACIIGANTGAICIENFGNFDVDNMTQEQAQAIVRVTASLCRKFNIIPNTDRILYHHWYDMNTGTRNNGIGKNITWTNKTCPGANFFGGNKVPDCQAGLIPLVEWELATL